MKSCDWDGHLISISRIQKRDGTDVSWLRLRGTVRGTTAVDFQTRLKEAGMRAPYLVVDLAELDYLNSTGLGMLLFQAEAQERRGGWLRIVAPSSAVAMILRLSGVAEKLSLYLDAEGALRDLPTLAA